MKYAVGPDRSLTTKWCHMRMETHSRKFNYALHHAMNILMIICLSTVTVLSLQIYHHEIVPLAPDTSCYIGPCNLMIQ